VSIYLRRSRDQGTVIEIFFTAGRRGILAGATGVIAICLLLGAGPSAAEVFRCVGPNGRTLYGDLPCPKGTAVTREISRQVGACVTEACEAKVRAQTEEAYRRLQEDKAELARMQDLRIRQEEAWAEVLAAQQAAAATTYQPPREEYVIWGGYPAWVPHRPVHFRHRRDKCDFHPHCLPGGGPRMTVKHGGARQRFTPGSPGSHMRVAVHR
jgi:hypothetical protein